ncbi:MAG: acyltransferase family protein [Aeromonas sp.]
MGEKKEFLYFFENLRGVAILMVMFSHITVIYEHDSIWQNLCRYLFGDVSSLFVFVSGYLFLYTTERKGYDYLPYLHKKAGYILYPYLLLSAVAIGYGIVTDKNLDYGLAPLQYGIWSLIVGGALIVPLWYIPMIWLVFLISPLLRYASRSSFFGPIVVVALFVSLMTARPLSNLNPFLSVFHFLGFYLMGMYFAQNGPLIQWAKSKVIPISVGLLIAYLLMYFWWFNTETFNHGFWDQLFHLNVLQLSKLIFVWLMYFIFAAYLNHPYKPMSHIAQISFGLFFVHGFWLYLFGIVLGRMPVENIIGRLAIQLLFCFVFSYISILIARKVLGKRSRYVVGC